MTNEKKPLLQQAMEVYDNPVVNTAIGFTPVVGDIQSGVEAIRSAMKGNYGEAALNAVGLLPFVPALGGMTRAAGALPEAVDAAKAVKTMDVYHGSPVKNITQFSDNGFTPTFTTPDRNYAAQYSTKMGVNNGKPGRVYDLKMEYNDIFDSKNPEHLALFNAAIERKNQSLVKRGLKPESLMNPGDPLSFVHADDFYRYLRSQQSAGKKIPFDALQVDEGVSSLFGSKANTSIVPLNSSQLKIVEPVKKSKK